MNTPRGSNVDAHLWSLDSAEVRQLEREAAEAEKRLQRLSADKALVHQLMWEGYVGPTWDEFAERLAGYGYGVLRIWIRNGKIFRECARCGFGGLERRSEGIPDDEADHIAIGTVAEAIAKFRDMVLIPGKWDPDRGASLNTYFIGQCIRQFSNVYRGWLRETAKPPPNSETLEEEAPAFHQEVDYFLREELERLGDDLANMLIGHEALGLSYQEIARSLDTSTRSVEYRVCRHRKPIAVKSSPKS